MLDADACCVMPCAGAAFCGPQEEVAAAGASGLHGGWLEGAYRVLSMLPHTSDDYASLDVSPLESLLLP